MGTSISRPGAISRRFVDDEIEHFFSLSEDELAAVRQRRTVLNRLALALQIGFLKMTGGTLNSVEIIPTGALEHLGRQLGCAPPRIASIRALYRRRRTLFDHQAAALHTLGRTEPSEHAERGLVAYLRREAAAVFDNVELMARSRSWLVDHDYLVLREREQKSSEKSADWLSRTSLQTIQL
jgi:hypothetical protein